ncbi:MAG TPA: hypothetical protein VJI67_04135, partial [archaeon]|nr:hypothetical protein [archaeon]
MKLAWSGREANELVLFLGELKGDEVIESLKDKATELRSRVSRLRTERDEANDSVKKTAGERRKAFDGIKAGVQEVKGEKAKRDEANAKAREAKAKRSELNAKLKELHSAFKEIATKAESFGAFFDKKALEFELRDLKKTLQAKYIPPQKEDRLVEQIEAMEQELEAIEKARELKKEVAAKGAALRELRREALSFHSAVLSAARESDEHHALVKESLNKTQKARKE